jgi:hypothetical protein
MVDCASNANLPPSFGGRIGRPEIQWAGRVESTGGLGDGSCGDAMSIQFMTLHASRLTWQFSRGFHCNSGLT